MYQDYQNQTNNVEINISFTPPK